MTHIWTEEEMIEGQERAIKALLAAYGMRLHKNGQHYQIIRVNGDPHNGPSSLAETAALALVECPPIGEKYEAPLSGPHPDEVCSDPEGVAYHQHEQQQRSLQQQIVMSLLKLSDLQGPVGSLVREAVIEGASNESAELAKASLDVLVRHRYDPAIPF